MQTTSKVQRLVSMALAAVLVLSVLVAAFPHPVQAAAPAVVCAKTHTVKAGETIYRIARTYNVTVNRLARANTLEFPYPLTAGQSLCIPEIAKVSSSVKWSAVLKEDMVKITGSGFKKLNPLYIKVRESDKMTWYKLGKTTTDNNGKMSVSFDLPKELEKEYQLWVCLKDGVTDLLMCKLVYRQ